jgi:hypothetical protein
MGADLLREIGVSQPQAAILCRDNICATYLLANPVFHASTKHIEVDYHFVRQRVAQKILDIRIISLDDQVADGFTLRLSRRKDYENYLNLCNL